MKVLLVVLIALTLVIGGCVIPIPIPISISWIDSLDLKNNSDAEDVPWSALKAFLKRDKTDELTYSDNFVCADFAVTLHNNAEKAGIKAGVVSIDFMDDRGHALNAFDTTDRGLLYIDVTGTRSNFPCSSDTTVVMEIGKVYIPESIFPCPGYYSTWEPMGIVKDFEVKW